ncbi:MAG: glutamine--fructose-6-phosphate transaminase (isomerizing), partial [Gemmataceae bacterium]
MCGIIGYVGYREAEPVLVEGLRRLEYRGYDSAGVATLTGAHMHLRKKAGRIADLVEHLSREPAPGCVGIGHTRWATHGAPNDRNSHPHVGGNGRVVVVHNGVIENYAELKSELQEQGVLFHSDTDTEVIAHLIARHLHGDLAEAVMHVLPLLKGTYGIAALSLDDPNVLVGARLGSPLVLGLSEDECFLASDPSALAGYADKVVYLDDHQVCVLTPEYWRILNRERVEIEASVHALETTINDIDLGAFDHFMLKEIYEQPEALENALRGRLDD